MREMGIGRPSAWQRFSAYPISRIFTYILVMAGIGMALFFPISGALKAFHFHAKHNAELAGLINEIYLALCAVGAYLVMVRVVEKRTWASAGVARRGLIRETGLGLLIGGVVFSLAVALTAALGGYHVSGWNLHFAWLVPLLLFLATAVFEETMFRGYIFQTLESRRGTGIALAGSGALFGLAHLANPVSGVTSAEKLAGPVFIVFEASLLLTAGFLLTRRLWLPIGIHWAWNFFESAVYGAPDSGEPANPVYTLFRAHFSGPFTLTGGPFGPEAGVVCFVVGTAAGLLLLRLAVRRGQWRSRPAPLSAQLSGSTRQEALP